MALVKCECGNRVSTEAKACPACGAPVKAAKATRGLGCLLVLIPLLALIVFGSTRKKDATPPGPIIIPYEVVKEKARPGDGKLLLDIVVSEKAAKWEVMQLAKELERKYKDRYATILIFDSHEAQRRRMDESYPAKELDRHLLLMMDRLIGDGTPKWTAEGRDH